MLGISLGNFGACDESCRIMRARRSGGGKGGGGWTRLTRKQFSPLHNFRGIFPECISVYDRFTVLCCAVEPWRAAGVKRTPGTCMPARLRSGEGVFF